MKKEEHELHELTNTTNKEKIIYKDLSSRIMEAVFEVHIFQSQLLSYLKVTGMKLGILINPEFISGEVEFKRIVN